MSFKVLAIFIWLELHLSLKYVQYTDISCLLEWKIIAKKALKLAQNIGARSEVLKYIPPQFAQGNIKRFEVRLSVG